MKTIIGAVLLAATAVVSGCDTPEQTVAAGAATGAVLGRVTAGDSKTRSTIIGAAVGAAAGAVVAGSQSGPTCKYRYPDGTVVVDECPK